MPPDRAKDMALLALPINPTLAFLRPERPSWFPGPTDFDGDHEAIGAAVRSLVEQAQAERPNDELIAFASPVAITMDRCVEVSVVRWVQAAGGSIADEDLAAHLNDVCRTGRMLLGDALEPLDTKTVLALPDPYEIADQKSRSWPLAKPLGLNRLGYLQHDLYPGRLFLPTMPEYDQLEVVPRNGYLEVKSDDEVVADLYYWNAGWGPVRPMQFDGNCGTTLVSRGTAYRELLDVADQDIRQFYFWRVRTLRREGSFGHFDETLSLGVVFM